MVNNRTFIFSHKLFQGFKRKIDLDEVGSIPDIINMMYIYLLTFLQHEKLEILVEKLNACKANLHIHNWTFGTILISDSNENIYICDHGSP